MALCVMYEKGGDGNHEETTWFEFQLKRIIWVVAGGLICQPRICLQSMI